MFYEINDNASSNTKSNCFVFLRETDGSYTQHISAETFIVLVLFGGNEKSLLSFLGANLEHCIVKTMFVPPFFREWALNYPALVYHVFNPTLVAKWIFVLLTSESPISQWFRVVDTRISQLSILWFCVVLSRITAAANNKSTSGIACSTAIAPGLWYAVICNSLESFLS
jgi:hypothetical protein